MEYLQEKLARFMRGRYGIDQMYYALVTVAFILLFVNLIVRSVILEVILWIVIFWIIYRAFSRNIYSRQEENKRFLKFWNPIKKQGSLDIRRLKDIRTHRYRTCPHCQKILRLPRKKGTHSVTCPVCHQEVQVHIPW